MREADIILDRISLIEFILEEDILSLYYNPNEKIWFIEYVDLQEDGEEYTIELDVEKLPMKIGDYILTKEEFNELWSLALRDEE